MLPLSLKPESQNSPSIERRAAGQRLSIINIAHEIVEQSVMAKGIELSEKPSLTPPISPEVTVEEVDNITPTRSQTPELESIQQGTGNQLQAEAARSLVNDALGEQRAA